MRRACVALAWVCGRALLCVPAACWALHSPFAAAAALGATSGKNGRSIHEAFGKMHMETGDWENAYNVRGAPARSRCMHACMVARDARSAAGAVRCIQMLPGGRKRAREGVPQVSRSVPWCAQSWARA